jgi:quercetin dioxygenase-like cupin family protein
MEPSIQAGKWQDAEVQAYDPAIFTGEVERRSLPSPDGGAGGLGFSWVRFVDGARTNWHSHDGGQILHVLEGQGRVTTEGLGTLTLESGDVVRTPPGVRHWHGALPGHTMTHLAVSAGTTRFEEPPNRPAHPA